MKPESDRPQPEVVAVVVVDSAAAVAVVAADMVAVEAEAEATEVAATNPNTSNNARPSIQEECWAEILCGRLCTAGSAALDFEQLARVLVAIGALSVFAGGDPCECGDMPPPEGWP